MLWRNRIYFQGEGNGGGGGDGGGGDGGAAAAAAAVAAAKGGGGTPWHESLPEGLKGHAGLTKFKDIPDLAQGYINAEKLVGADKIVLPGKDAKPEERDAAMAAIFDKLGRPKTAEEYQFPEVKDRPYTDADKALQKGFAPIAHKLGLTQGQVAGIAEFQTQLALAGIAAQTKALGESEAALRKEWGDKFDENLEKGNVAVTAILNSAKVPLDQWKGLKLSDGSFVGDNPLMIKLFAEIGERMGETAFNGDGGTGKGDPFANPAAAKAELDRLKAGPLLEKDHPYKNKRHPDHKTWSKRVMDLQSLASRATAK